MDTGEDVEVLLKSYDVEIKEENRHGRRENPKLDKTVKPFPQKDSDDFERVAQSEQKCLYEIYGIDMPLYVVSSFIRVFDKETQ